MKNMEQTNGATPLDPNEIEGLRIKYITTKSELDRWEQENIQDALAWLDRRRKTDILTESFIGQLHEKMFGKVWQWAGEFRKTDKNIGVSWMKIPTELRMLLDDVKFWIENSTYAPDEIAYRFHHKLVWIHPFPNGNGRHARMMTDLILEETLNIEPFTWGSQILTNPGGTRRKYIEALKKADKQNYTELAIFVRS